MEKVVFFYFKKYVTKYTTEGMDFKKYLEELTQAGTLPGFEGQKKMAPKQLNETIKSFVPKSNYKESSVLILINESHLYNKPEIVNYEVLLTKRSEKLRHHSGQISFPGGRKESEESSQETAIRETFEEIGLTSSSYSIVGEISKLYAPPSNSLISPFVAFLKNSANQEEVLSKLFLSPEEVESAFFVDLNYLADKNNVLEQTKVINAKETVIPYWDLSQKFGISVPLWGATAIILSELLAIYTSYRTQHGNR